MKLNYFNIQKFCLHDGPGIRTTVFLKGCPIRCLWCHNPESQRIERELMFAASKCTSCGLCVGYCDARHIDPETHRLVYEREKCTVCGKCAEVCPHRVNSVRGKTDDTDAILAEVMKDIHYYETSGGGMTVSGGEPAMQPDGVLELIEKAKSKGVVTAIETCGVGSREFYTRAADMDCIFLFDLKGIDDEKHKANTGVGVEKIHANLDYLLERGARVIARIPLIPAYNDSAKDLELMRDFLAARADKLDHAEIMPYHALGVEKRRNLGREADDSIPEGRKFAEKWRETLAQSGVEVLISGS